MTNILPVRILLAFGLAASLTCDLGAQAVNRPTKKTTSAVQPELSFKARLLAEANRGDPKAQFNLGLCFIDGADCERSYDQALKWLRQSAEGGNSEAQWFLVQFRGDTGDEKEILGDKYGNRPESLFRAKTNSHFNASGQIGRASCRERE